MSYVTHFNYGCYNHLMYNSCCHYVMETQFYVLFGGRWDSTMSLFVIWIFMYNEWTMSTWQTRNEFSYDPY